MKKIIYTLTILLFSGIVSFGQIPGWPWAKNIGGSNYDQGNSITTDGFGNAYLTGGFKSSAITFGSATLTNAGNYDVFIAKYDPSGNVLWAQRAGGSGDDWGYSITTDSLGNVYLTGMFKSSTITFGSTTLTNAGSNTRDIFIVKYDPSGNVLWAQNAGGSNDDSGNSISADSLGNVYLTGNFKSSVITFGSTTLTNDTTNGTPDMFFVKYNANGNVLWAQRAGGTGGDDGNSISTDSYGNIYLTGYFQSSAIIFGSYTLTNTGSYDVFIAKYDPSGNVLWAKSAVGSGMDFSTSITTDSFDNVYLTGWFVSSTITFGSDTLTNAGGGVYPYDIFIAKYDSSGNVLWAQRAGGTGSDAGNSISTDSYGNIYLTGYFNSSAIIFGSDTLINAGISDIFITKYDSSGNVLWAKRNGGSLDDNGYSIAIDDFDNGYITGMFKSSAIAFDSDTLTNAGNYDIYIAKLSIADNNGPVCEGSSLSLTASTVSGATYSWSGPDGYISSLQNPTVSDSATTTMTGIYSVTVTVGGSAIATGSTNATVYSIPVAPTAGNNGPVCEGSILFLTADTVSGAIYAWTGPNGFASSLQNPVISDSAVLTMTGTYYVSVIVNGCVSPEDSTSVVIDSIQTVPVITPSSNITFCQGDSVILTSSIADHYLWSDSSTTQSITVLDSGVYTVIVSDSIGCSATSLPTVVTVYSNPVTPTITQLGDSLQSSAAATYQWYLNGVVINGDTSQICTPTQNGDYTVVITDSNGCSAISPAFNYTYVGINNIDNEDLIIIFPNPTGSNFTIKVPPATRQIKILNSVGQLLSRTCGIEGQKNLDFELAYNGIYFIQITMDKQVITKKLIVCK
ncbi:MAG: SBBP repeat-containing protein [Bacteroidales bacterium]